MAGIVLNVKYEFGQRAFIKSDTDQKPHIVTSYLVQPGDVIRYELCGMIGSRWFYDFEITPEPDPVLKVTS